MLNDDQRQRRAVQGRILGPKVLGTIGTIVTPATIWRWHWMLVTQKCDYSHRRRKIGRPPVSQATVDLVLSMARDNPTDVKLALMLTCAESRLPYGGRRRYSLEEK